MRCDHNPLAETRSALRRAHRRIALLEHLLICIHTASAEDTVRSRIAAEFMGNKREKGLTGRRMRVRGEILANREEAHAS